MHFNVKLSFLTCLKLYILLIDLLVTQLQYLTRTLTSPVSKRIPFSFLHSVESSTSRDPKTATKVS